MDLLGYFGTITSSVQSVLISILVICLVSYIIKWLISPRRNLPPGPYGLPFVGYIPFMKQDISTQFTELGNKYGKVFSMQLGSRLGVVLQDHEAIKEFYARPEFLDRANTGPIAMIPHSMGFGMENGKLWEEQRKHSLTMMRNAGMGKSFFENEIHEEIRLVLNRIEEKKGSPSDITQNLFDSLCNIMWMLLFGYRLEATDPRRNILYKMLFAMMDFLSSFMVLYYFNWMTYVVRIFRPKAYRETMDCYNVFEQMIDKQIQEKKKTLKDRTATDFTDFFLHEMDAEKGNPNTSFTNTMMKGNVLSYFVAGIMSTQTSIIWLLLTLADKPDTQEKIYEELHNVTGSTREIFWDDRKQTPFTMAVIYELQRWKTMAPAGDFRTCHQDVKFRGYDIPKGSMIFPQLWAVHHDPKVWNEPNKFKPERFLSSDGKSNVKPQGYFAFSQGRRNCPGEQVAYFQIYLFLTWIIQRYEVKPEVGKKIDIDTEQFLFLNMPLPQNIRFIKRD